MPLHRKSIERSDPTLTDAVLMRTVGRVRDDESDYERAEASKRASNDGIRKQQHGCEGAVIVALIVIQKHE
jgi:hypothetical protein